jgi:hypothetical protein
MSHRATIYSVRVHEAYKPDEARPFGNIDGNGTYLAQFLEQAFTSQFAVGSHDGNRDVSCERCSLIEPDLQVVLRPGERGVRADFADENGRVGIFEQEPQHTQLLKCGCLFRLPRNQTNGWVVFHVNHGRSVKSLVSGEITRRFRQTFTDLVLEINPVVDSAAFEAALEQDQLLSVNLYRHSPPTDIRGGRKWGRTDSGLKLQLTIQPDRGKRLLPNLVRKALRGDTRALGEIVEFAGIPYEEAKFEVELPNGTKRSYNIHDLEAGHAMSEDIELEPGEDGYPTDDSLFGQLEGVLAELQ